MNRRRLVALAGVLAFVLVVGTVAVVASRSGGGSTPSTLPKLTYAAGQNKDEGVARAALAPAFPVTYEVRGTLPKLAETAPAYAIREDASRSRIDRLAAALGVAADHVQVDPTAKPTLGAAPTLVVFQGSWSLMTVPPDCSVSSEGVTSCSATVSSGSANASSATGTPEDCPMPPCPEGHACAQVCPDKGGPVAVAPPQPAPPPARPADLPSQGDAERIGRGVLEKAGIDLAGADVRVDDQFSSWAVTVSPRVGGLPTQGVETMVNVGPKGAIVGGSGSLVTFTKVGDYPLAGTTVGLERLRAGRFTGPVPLAAEGVATMTATAEAGSTGSSAGSSGGGSGGGSAPSDSGSTGSGAVTVAPSPPVSPPIPPAPAPDAKQPLPVPDRPEPVPPTEQKVVITGVHVALVRSFGSQQDQKLLPVYVFETDASTAGIGRLPLFPVPAVTDALLAADTTPPIKP